MIKIKTSKLYRKLYQEYFRLMQEPLPDGIVPIDADTTYSLNPTNVTRLLVKYFPNHPIIVNPVLKNSIYKRVSRKKAKIDHKAKPNYYWPWMPKDRLPE